MLNAFEHAADILDPTGPDWAQAPVEWADAHGIELWSKQQNVLTSIRDNANTAVHSCHSVGKSFVAATATGWWIDSHPAGEAFVVTSAPTGDQVKAVLWREINRMHKSAGLVGYTNMTEWLIGGELVAFGRKPSEYNPTAFQGVHALYVLVILDEACGIPQVLWDAASTLASNEYARQLAIGNPDDPATEFQSVCSPGSGWNVIHIGYEDTPNFTGEGVSERLRLSLISKRWVEDRKLRWGEGSAIFTSKVLGQFPAEGTDVVVPFGKATQCRYLELPEGKPVELGVDVAGGGADRTIIRERRGMKVGRSWELRETDSEKIVDAVVKAIKTTGATRVKIDSIGVGFGVAGSLNRRRKLGQHRAHVNQINVSRAPVSDDDKKKYKNLRAKIWWEVGRDLTVDNVWDLGALDDDAIAELTAPKWDEDASGRIQIEDKEDTKKRIGRSPDEADALLLAFYHPTMPEESFEDQLLEASIPGVNRRR